MRVSLVVFCIVAAATATGSAQETQGATANDFGGTYDSLKPEQKALVDDWMKRFGAVIHKQVDAQQAYNNLLLSTRTTFNAVTHALMSTQLTDASGRKLGPAIQIVDKVDTVRGENVGARGDEQFRIYVQLKPGALDLLDKTQEFRHMEDNTVYHKGYPICYRSTPPVPSIQVSATRDKTRADVDVDYKSSGFPKGLVNGHLSASNSDVRAGNNDNIHNRQWSGLNNWWRNLLSLGETRTDAYAQEGRAIGDTKTKATTKPDEAVHDFLNTWLVEKKPEDVIPYFAQQSYACGELEAGERLDRGMAPFRLLMAMRKANERFGNVSELSEISTAVPLPKTSERTKLVEHRYQGQFALYKVREDAAERFICVNRLDATQISPKAAASKSFGKYYGAIFRLGRKDGSRAATLATLWMRGPNDYLRLISYDVDPTWGEDAAPNVAPKPPSPAATRFTGAPTDLISGATKFLEAWLVKQDMDDALRYVSTKCAQCVRLNRDDGDPEPQAADAQADLKKAMRSVIDTTGRVTTLEEAVLAPSPSHDEIELVKHSHSKAFALVSIPDHMGEAMDCARRTPGEQVMFKPAAGGKSNGTYYAMGLRLVKAGENSGVLWAVWAQEGSAWKLVSYTVLAP